MAAGEEQQGWAKVGNRSHELPVPSPAPPPQGDLAKQVAAFLQEAYGIPPALMDVKGGKGK